MTAQIVALRDRQLANTEDLLAAVVELHALVSIDPVMGASPVRIYFVFNPVAKQRIAACHDLEGGRRAPLPAAYALVAYDLPFALHLVETSARQIGTERAKAIVTASAELQGDMLRQAASALGIEADPVADFDADELKTVFFPSTQESVTQVLMLALRSHRMAP